MDDEPDILELVKEVLEASLPGWVVDIAENGQAALLALVKNPPTIMVCDYRMPGMTGLELATAVRAAGHEFPIVVITAWVDSNLNVEVSEARTVQSLLRKPIDVDDLVAAILALNGRSVRTGRPLEP